MGVSCPEAAPAAEAEDDDGLQGALLDHLDDLLDVRARVPAARRALGPAPAAPAAAPVRYFPALFVSRLPVHLRPPTHLSLFFQIPIVSPAVAASWMA